MHKLSAALMLAAMLAACAEDAQYATPDNGSETASVEISFDIACRADACTRSVTPQPRQLNTEDNWQATTDVRLYIFRSASPSGPFRYCRADYSYAPSRDYIEVPAFATTKTPGQHYTGGLLETHTYQASVRLEKGYYYQFLAVGRDDIAPADSTHSAFKALNLQVGKTRIDSVEAQMLADQTSCTELFTGTGSVHEINHLKTTIADRIEMRRAVAGILLYIYDIPYKVSDGTLDMTQLAQGVLVANKYVVRRLALVPKRRLCRSVFAVSRTVADQLADETRPYITIDIPANQPYDEATNKYTFTPSASANCPNAIAARGVFVTPQPTELDYTEVEGHTPLQLVYYGDNDKELLRRDVRMKPEPGEPLLNNYPLLANHLYCLGRVATDQPQSVYPREGDDSGLILVWGGWQDNIDIEL